MSKREQLIDQLLKDLDAATTGAVRFISSRTSRRSFLGKFGMFLAGMGTLPMLPVVRDAHAQSSDEFLIWGIPILVTTGDIALSAGRPVAAAAAQ